MIEVKGDILKNGGVKIRHSPYFFRFKSMIMGERLGHEHGKRAIQL